MVANSLTHCNDNLQRILDRLGAVQPNGNGYMARCPVHDDDKASLHVSEGRDGRVREKWLFS